MVVKKDKKSVLVIGPSPLKSRGGMATIMEGIESDSDLRNNYAVDIYGSYVDGNRIKVYIYSFFKIIKFFFIVNKYEIFHIHAASRGSTFRKGIYVCIVKLWRKRVIFHIHGAEYIKFYNEISDYQKKLVLGILNKADMVVALSNEWKEMFEQTFFIKNCYVVENGIEMSLYKEAKCDCRTYIKKFAVLGRLGKRKGTYDLVRAIELAVREVPDLVCYIAGDGEIEAINKIIISKKLEKNIKLLGWISQEEKIALLKKVSTLVLPSHDEGLPMAILEGMASGKAIISTPVGAIPEVIGCENGILVPVENVDALSNAIVKCCKNPDMVQQFSINNIEKINQKYSREIMHRKIKDLYEKVKLL